MAAAAWARSRRAERLVDPGKLTAQDRDATLARRGHARTVRPQEDGDGRARPICRADARLYNGFDDSKYRPSALPKQMCDASYIGRKTGKGFFVYETVALRASMVLGGWRTRTRGIAGCALAVNRSVTGAGIHRRRLAAAAS